MRQYRHFSQEERTFISAYREQGRSLSEIAGALGRCKSSISREIRRNTNRDGYSPSTALARYYGRRQRPSRLDKDQDLCAYVLDLLYEGLSPETIAIRLKVHGAAENLSPISYEAIYQWLYKPQQKKQKLYKLLVRHHGKRGRRKRVHRGHIKDRLSIHERPSDVLSRQEFGHFEADLMSFKGNTQHLLVIHERKTRYTSAIPLPSKSAAETVKALLSFFSALPNRSVKSVTFDNGLEFAAHTQLRDKLGIQTYFCDVYASWQKGGIENMNGRLRRDLPRKTDLKTLRPKDLETILMNHNFTPRKCLNGQSPIEALANQQGKNIIFSFRYGVALHG